MTPTSPYTGHHETAGLDEAWQQGFKAAREEVFATIRYEAAQVVMEGKSDLDTSTWEKWTHAIVDTALGTE